MKKKLSVISKINNNNVKKKQVQFSTGFTLVELLATIAILSIIVSIVIFFAFDIVGNAKKKSYQATVSNIENKATNYVLEEFSSHNWVSLAGSTSQYQCITVQNLIDSGYFSSDILESKVDDNRNVFATDSIWIERNETTKTITKNVLLVGKNANYIGLCSNMLANGIIDISINPLGWVSEDKNISINYSIDNYDRVDKYRYEYVFENNNMVVLDEFSDEFTSSSKKLNVLAFENGTLCAKIVKIDDNGVIASKCQTIFDIDKVLPLGEIKSTNDVADVQTVTLKMTDSESGVSEYYFGKSNPATNDVEWVDVSDNGIVNIDDVLVNEEGKYYLVVRDAVGNESEVVETVFYKTTLLIDNGSVEPNVIITQSGNSFEIPKGNAIEGYKFVGWYTTDDFIDDVIETFKPITDGSLYGKTVDAVGPVIIFSTDGSGGKWIKTAESTITVTDASGVDDSTLKYIYSRQNNAVPSIKFSNGSSVAARGKNDIYYLIAYACDNVGNCTTEVSEEFKLDNTPPVITCNKKNAWYYQKIIGSTFAKEEVIPPDTIKNGLVYIQVYDTVDYNYISSEKYDVTKKEDFDEACSVFIHPYFRGGDYWMATKEVFSVEDNSGVIDTTEDWVTYKTFDEDGHTKAVNSSGNSCLFKGTSCNCISGYCVIRVGFRTADEAGNFAPYKYFYYYWGHNGITNATPADRKNFGPFVWTWDRLRSTYCKYDSVSGSYTTVASRYACTES